MSRSESLIIKALTPIGIPLVRGIQLRYDCPRCENELGMDTGKHNLEVNVEKLAYKCWACGQHGSVYGLIKKYGYQEFLDNFKRKKEDTFDDDEKESEIFELPKSLTNASNIKEALEYLLSRGLTREQIKEREVKYCFAGDYKGCLIFPSYDSTGKLNAFVSHNLYTKKYKKKKAKDFRCFYESFIDKKSLIIVTEGIYDALTVPNAIPMLGIGVEDPTLDFLSGMNILLIIDNDVSETVASGLIDRLETVCSSVTHHIINKEYQDLNHYHTSCKEGIKEELKQYYK